MDEEENGTYSPTINQQDTMQAQHQMGNDFPVYVNPNAVLVSLQTQTLALIGSADQKAADRMQQMQEASMERLRQIGEYRMMKMGVA